MRRRHKARHAAHERAHLVLSVPHVQRDRGFPGAQPSPVRPIPPHLRRNQVRTVFCIVTCFICQSEFKQESSRSGAVEGPDLVRFGLERTRLYPHCERRTSKAKTYSRYIFDEGCWFSESSLKAGVKVHVRSIICSGSASSGEQHKRVASHVTANTFV